MKYCISALLLFLLVFFSAGTRAGPAAPVETEIRQPDGTTFIAIARGDEHANWIETSEGHTIVNVDGTWYYAEKDEEGGLRATTAAVGSLSPEELQALPLHLAPEPDPEAFAPVKVRKIPRNGAGMSQEGHPQLRIEHTQFVLTVLVDYQDQTFTYSDDSFQSLIYGASGSVKEYFLENSYGGFTIVPPRETYGTNDDGIVHVVRAATNHPNEGKTYNSWKPEAREIVGLTDSFVDYAAYDANGDSVVSADELSIIIILAGYEASFGATPLEPNVWGHRAFFDSPLTLDGVELRPYAMFGEAHATSLANEHQATIGIMCHELGHLMFDLPDLYDVDGSSEGIGDWGLMGSGSWNFSGTWSGDTPAHMTAWSKVATNFTIPEDIDTDQSGVNIAEADANEVAKRIWVDKYKLGEYFLVENRQLSGYDAGLPGSGLMIWHVDDKQTTNADENHKWVDLEAADGATELDDKTNKGDPGDPFPGSTNNTAFDGASTPDSNAYSGSATGISVTAISASAATMTADFGARAGGVGDHVRYDENGFNAWAGFGSTTAWVGLHVLNDTEKTVLDGIEVYVNDPTGATIDFSYYTGMAGGTPSGPIHSQDGIAAGPGWNRVLLAEPQPFPVGAERGIVLKIVNDSNTSPVALDISGVDSGRSYFSGSGVGTFLPICFPPCADLNLVALLSDGGAEPPTATVITPSTTGPTNADSVGFDVTFSENVVNFNDSNDVTITHSGTSNSGVTITGAGSSYTATVTGIAGTGSFTLEVNTGSDVQNASGVALASSVTSAAVNIDNTPPAISIGPPSAGSSSGEPVSFTVTYTGADSVSLASGDVTLNRTGTADGAVGVTGSGTSARTVTVSSITGDGTLGISIAAGTAADNAGNSAGAAGPSATFTVSSSGDVIHVDSFESR